MELLDIAVDYIKNFDLRRVPPPPYSHEFLENMPPKLYPLFLRKVYRVRTGSDLNLKNPKTLREKIQWLKLYDSIPLKSQLTDKVLVRDWVKNFIDEKYLKPVLWIGKSFDEIPFDKITADAFIIKTNHGCKWQYTVKDKSKVMDNDVLMNIMKSHFDGWMSDSFFYWSEFEFQYKNIEPQILVEPLLRDSISEKPQELEIYCFNGEPKILQRIKYAQPRQVSVFDENFNNIDLKFMPYYQFTNEECDDNLRLAVELSKPMAKDFKLARLDWLVFDNKIYFNEITFTPFSGFFEFEDISWDLKLGKLLDLDK